MQLKTNLTYAIIMCCLIFQNFLLAQFYCESDPVTVHGQLQVNGNKIVDQNGQVVSFAGMSYYWSNSGFGAGDFYNADVVSWLEQDWDVTIVRAALGLELYGGYLQEPAINEARVRAVVEAAIANGIYVIIDFHTHIAQDHQGLAIDFFQRMARDYGGNPHVIYEIYNEPVDIGWSNGIKPYAEAVINAIRAEDPDNLIVVGTPNYSTDVDVVSLDPITIDDNIAYTLHFYAATHGEWLRDKARVALNNGIAIMVTEWGTVDAQAQGSVDYNNTNLWMDFCAENDLTHLNWSIHDLDEPASALLGNANVNGGWPDNQISESGQFVRGIIRDWGENCSGGSNPGNGTIPLTIRARGLEGGEHLSIQINDQTEADITLGTTMTEYNVSVSAGILSLDFDNDNGSRDVQIDWVDVNGEVRQAEDQEINTGVWTGVCGGSFSEFIHCQGEIVFGEIQGGSSGNIIVRARGVQGDELITVYADGVDVGTFQLSTDYLEYAVSGSGTVVVDYINDNLSRDVQVDYVSIDGQVLQAEDQLVNTGVWTGVCGGSYSEWIHCPGSITFENGSPGTNTISVRARGTQGDEIIEVLLDGNPAAAFQLSTDFSLYEVEGTGTVRVAFINDAGARDVQVDYIEVNGQRFESEDQVLNTGVWQGQCGGSYSEWIHCGGYIEYNGGSGASNLSAKLPETNLKELVLSPNPAKGFFTIGNLNGNKDTFNIRILDLQGREFLHKTMRSKQGEIRVGISGLPSNTYVVQLTKDGQSVTSKLLIVNK